MMEKYSQYRDRGSGVSPFLPVSSYATRLSLPVHVFLFLFKLPFFLTAVTTYFLILQWFPLGSFIKKAMLWTMLGTPGIWWIDLQIDGVKKGSLAKKHEGRVPFPSSVIASSSTSPIDALYLAAIFDPIFTVSYPHTRQVEYISLLGAILRALSKPRECPSKQAKMTDLSTLVAEHPRRIIVVFPECTSTNGQGVLPLSPSLLMTPPRIKIFPVHLRYSPPDITTPIPRAYWAFLWNLLSQSTHCIRVRIAEGIYNTSESFDSVEDRNERYLQNVFENTDDEHGTISSSDMAVSQGNQGTKMSANEAKVLDKVGEALARLGRAKRVGLSVRDKINFVEAWSKQQK